MDSTMDSLPDRPLTKGEVKAITEAGEIECPTWWTLPTASEEAEIVSLLLIVDQTLYQLSYDDGWTKRVLTDDVTDLESFTALELASYARIQNVLDVSEEDLDMYRNDPSRPAP